MSHQDSVKSSTESVQELFYFDANDIPADGADIEKIEKTEETPDVQEQAEEILLQFNPKETSTGQVRDPRYIIALLRKLRLGLETSVQHQVELEKEILELEMKLEQQRHSGGEISATEEELNVLYDTSRFYNMTKSDITSSLRRYPNGDVSVSTSTTSLSLSKSKFKPSPVRTKMNRPASSLAENIKTFKSIGDSFTDFTTNRYGEVDSIRSSTTRSNNSNHRSTSQNDGDSVNI